jgi:hypothetical protein
MQLTKKPGNAATRIWTHREMNDKTKCQLTFPLRLLIEPATILFSRVPVLNSRGSQLPLIRLHDETEMVSGSWLLATSAILNFSIQYKKVQSHIQCDILNTWTQFYHLFKNSGTLHVLLSNSSIYSLVMPCVQFHRRQRWTAGSGPWGGSKNNGKQKKREEVG